MGDRARWAYIILFKRLFCWAYFRGWFFFGGAYYWKEFCISKWVGFDNKNSITHYGNSVLKTASTNSQWAYVQEGLLSEGFLCLTFGGLIFGRAYLFVHFFTFLERGG